MAKSETQNESKSPFIKLLIVLVLIGVGVGYFLHKFKVSTTNGRFTIQSREPTKETTGSEIVKPNIKMPPIRKGRGDQIQIATFNAGPMDDATFASDTTIGLLAATIRNFDLVALQDIRVHDPGKLDLITSRLKKMGRHYEYVISPGQTPQLGSFNAFLFDRASLEIDRDQVFLLIDPSRRLDARPLSALFRVRGPAKDQAFTFVAVNVYISPHEREAELDLVPDILETVRKNHPEEDDVILMASLQTSPDDLKILEQMTGITYAVSGISNMVLSNYLADNLLFDRRATIEYVGESGVYDLVRRLQLKEGNAAEVARHLPVWAKFSIYEGGRFIK